MDVQEYINILLGSVCALLGWVLRTLWESVRELREQDQRLAAKVEGIEVLVAGDYVRRDELVHSMDRIYNKLESMDDKLDGKADR